MKTKTTKVKTKNKFKSLLKVTLFFFLPSFFLFWLWYNYFYQPKDIHLIEASKGSFKIKPESTIKTQNNSFYESMYEKNKNASAVKFLPIPEKPLKTEKNFGIDEISEIIDDINQENSLTKQYNSALKNHELIITTTHKTPLKLLSSAKPTKIKLLLGAFGSKSEAVNSWNVIKTQQGKILDKYTYELETNENKSHGVYNLLLLGVKDIEDGYRLCKKFIQKNQTCVLLEK
ncbi:MAG: hypothetical protein K9G11_02930 [Rickettsiaceae bacterium]|nr:hypothetical protein [Rickettsiaceae bacterium]